MNGAGRSLEQLYFIKREREIERERSREKETQSALDGRGKCLAKVCETRSGKTSEASA